MANWKAYRVSEVVSEIDDERYVLPVIQRELVWTEEKMELLFDSLLKGNSFGGVIVIEEDKDSKPLFASRRFSKDGNQMQSQAIVDHLAQTQNFVVDGQQRLQSFYIGLKGSFHGKSLFFDLYSDYKSFFEFQFSANADLLPASTKEERLIKQCLWVSVNDLYNRLKDSGDEEYVADDYIEQKNVIEKEKQEHIKKNIKIFFRNVISVETIGIAKVTVDKRQYTELENRQRIVELFKRLNDGGTKLSPIELVASTLKAFDWRMEGFLRRMEHDFSDIGLTSDNLIKLIFLLQDNYTKEMTSIEATDADFAVQKQDRIEATMKSVRSFLETAKLYDYYKEGNTSFIPLFFVAYHLFHKDISNNDLLHYWDDYETSNIDYKPMCKWLYNSLLNGVFRSRGAGWVPYKTGIRKLLSEIKNYKNQVFPFAELENVYITHPINYTSSFTTDVLDSLDMQFVFYLIYDRKRQVRANDIDHIMPKSILERLKYDYSDINSIRNFQLLDYGTNRGEKNGKPFKEWVNNPEYVRDKNLYVKTHLIPSDETLWTEDKFIEFRNKRSELIVAKINSLLL